MTDRTYMSNLMKKMFKAAFLTSLVSEFTQMIALLIDGIIVCRFFEQDEVAAVGLANPFFFLVGVPATGLAAGLQTVCSKEMGRGKIENVNYIFSETMIITTVSMAILSCVTFLTIPQMAVLFGARGNAADLLTYTENYLYGLAFEILPFVLLSLITPIVILDNGSKIVTISAVLGCLSNITLDLFSVKMNKGLFGIGLASSLSAAVSLLVLFAHFLKKDHVIRFRFVPFRLHDIKEILMLGAPKAVHALANALRSGILNTLVIAVGGSVAMSVLTIQGMISDLVDIPAMGISGAVGILAGISYGELNGEDLKRIGIHAHRYIFSIVGILSALLLVLSRPVSSFYMDSSDEGISLLLYVIGCIAVGSVFSALIYARISYLQAIEKIRDAQIIETGANLIILLAAAMILSVPFGIYGIFAAFPVSKLVMLLIIWLIHVKRTKTLFPSAECYMELDDSFHPSVGDIIAYPFGTFKDCQIASEQVRLFCKGHKLKEKEAYLSSLCMEEITTNIIKHGLRSKRGTAEIRVTIYANNMIIRVRDNGIAFNISNFAKLLAAEEPFVNIGMKILCGTADDISYYRIYGMNTTIIKLSVCKL